MENKWSNVKASEFIDKYSKRWGEDLAFRTYTSRLIGAEKELVLHGGGNTSVKSVFTNVFGDKIPVLFVKASGHNLANIEPEGHTGLNLEYLQKLQTLADIDDEVMLNELLTHKLHAKSATPSIETLSHAFIPFKYIDHTHADSILALSNQVKGEENIREALGKDIIILGYVKPGFSLAREVANAIIKFPASQGIVLMKHGLITWGETAKESYEKTIELVTKAEKYLAKNAKKILQTKVNVSNETVLERYHKIAPILRGLLAIRTKNDDCPFQRVMLKPLITKEAIDFVNSDRGKEIALTPPLTSDHLIRTKSFPLWIDDPQYNDEKKLHEQIATGIDEYVKQYNMYVERNVRRLKTDLIYIDPMPRIIMMPGIGVVCSGRDIEEAELVSDIASQTIQVKSNVAAMGNYEALSEEHLFDMEYFSLQHAKLNKDEEPALKRTVALITGAAGAIGTGICQGLLENGCHVAITDLPGKNLDAMDNEFKKRYGSRVISVPLDVTKPESVAKSFAKVIETWGGIDLLIVNAGIAHVSTLADMKLIDFRKLEEVNIEGALNVLSEVSRFFKAQGTGGDIVLVSTKNVFSPGAKFGAYSATKAAAHQLARIASLELAEIGVRVNMVAPDAVFSHGKHKSGLWAKVGPDRMLARGLDEEGLEEYYQNRNLLKAKVTATHVSNAVIYFATRQSPTTGATIPVDGGLPDSTPR